MPGTEQVDKLIEQTYDSIDVFGKEICQMLVNYNDIVEKSNQMLEIVDELSNSSNIGSFVKSIVNSSNDIDGAVYHALAYGHLAQFAKSNNIDRFKGKDFQSYARHMYIASLISSLKSLKENIDDVVDIFNKLANSNDTREIDNLTMEILTIINKKCVKKSQEIHTLIGDIERHLTKAIKSSEEMMKTLDSVTQDKTFQDKITSEIADMLNELVDLVSELIPELKELMSTIHKFYDLYGEVQTSYRDLASEIEKFAKSKSSELIKQQYGKK